MAKLLEENKKLNKISKEYQDLQEQQKENISNLKIISKQNE
jgi:hypothetical protein